MFASLFILCVGVAIMWMSILIVSTEESLEIIYKTRPLYYFGYLLWALGNLLIGFTLLGLYS